mgnify:CR=1 FL=1
MISHQFLIVASIARQFFVLVPVADRIRYVVPQSRHGWGMCSTCRVDLCSGSGNASYGEVAKINVLVGIALPFAFKGA